MSHFDLCHPPSLRTPVFDPAFLDVTAIELVGIAAVYLFAAFVKGSTGLGFSTTCLPFLALLLGLKEALPLVIIPSVTGNIIVMVDARRFRQSWRRFWPMLLAAVPGVVLGLVLLDRVDSVTAAGVLGIVLLAFVLYAFLQPELRLADGLERPLGPFVGFTTGIVNGLTGTQIMPLLPFMLSLPVERDVFVQTINWSFTLSSLTMMLGLSRLGLLTATSLVVSTAGLACVWVGVKLGGRVRNRLSPRAFRAAVLALLLILGTTLIVRWLA